MKLLSKIQLIALALEVFKQNPDIETCYAREDGNIFFLENYAQLGRGQMKVYELAKSEILTATQGNIKNGQSIAATKIDTNLANEGKSPDTRTIKHIK